MKNKYSIIVPVYNCEKFLCECIDSVLVQTYPEFELILVDDGSVDNSGKICDEYALKDNRIKVFHKLNKGQLHTREFGISKSTNEWLIFIDSDDYIEANTLEILNKKIIKYNCDCIVYNFRRFNSETVLSIGKSLNKEFVIADKSELFKLLLLNSQYNSMCRKAVKRSCFNTKDYSKFYNLRISEDRLHSAEVFENATKVIFINEILYNYRDNDTSVTNNISLEMITNFLVEEHLLNIVKKTEIFSDKDFIDYRTAMIKRIITAICVISTADISKKDKIIFLNKIKDSEFYKKFISQGKIKRTKVGTKYIIFFLFKYRLYNTIFTIEKLYKLLKN